MLPVLAAIGVAVGSLLASGCNKKEKSSPKPSEPDAIPKSDSSQARPSDRFIPSSPKGSSISFNGRTLSSTSGVALKSRVDLEGDPSVGTIFFLRNYHTPGMEVMHSDDPRLVDYRMFIVASQWEALQLLEQLGAKNVFYERVSISTTGPEYTEELRSQDPRILPIVDTLRSAGREMPDYGLGIFNVDIGAPYSYALRNPEVHLHPVFTPEEQLQSIGIMKSGDEKARNKDFFDREAWATRNIMKYLQAHPGESIVVVFGAIHNFCDDFIKADFKPRIVSAWYEFPNNYTLWSDYPPVRIQQEWNINSPQEPLPPKCP